MGIGVGERVRPVLIAVGTAIVIAAGPIVAATLEGHFSSNELTQCRAPEGSQEG